MKIKLKTIAATLLLSAVTHVHCMDSHERETSISLSSTGSFKARNTKALEFGEPDYAQRMQLYTVEYPNLYLQSLGRDLGSETGAFFINPPGFACPHRLGYADQRGDYNFLETEDAESCFFNDQIIPGKISFKAKEKDVRFIIDLNTNKVEIISIEAKIKDLFNSMFLPNRRNYDQASESNKIRTDVQGQLGAPWIFLSKNKYINRESIIGLLTGKIKSAFYDSSKRAMSLHHINVTETTAVFDEMLRSGDFSNFSFAHPVRPYTPETVIHEYTLLWSESPNAYQSIGKLRISESPEITAPLTGQSAAHVGQFSSKTQMRKELLKATIAGDTDTVFQIITSEAERLTKSDLTRVFTNALTKGHIAIAKRLIESVDQNVINDHYIKAKNHLEIRDLLRPFVSTRYQGY